MADCRVRIALVGIASIALAGMAQAQSYNGVSAGDVTANDAELWSRYTDGSGTSVNLTAQIATDPGFANIVHSYSSPTSVNGDFTAKLDATGLAANQKYYYRFTAPGGAASQTGSFSTTPAANQAVEVKFGFSGDADGRFRPYPSVNGFGTAANPGSQNLNFFVFLGDTMYETASTGSPAVTALTSTSTPATVAQGLADYHRKYLENVSGVTAAGATTTSGQQGLQAMLGATSSFTLLDNHELGNQSLQSGGAPLTAGTRVLAGAGMDVNTTGAYNNQTPAYQALTQAYLDYHPTKANLVNGVSTGPTVVASNDPRSNGTPQQYSAT